MTLLAMLLKYNFFMKTPITKLILTNRPIVPKTRYQPFFSKADGPIIAKHTDVQQLQPKTMQDFFY